jgi:serine/threonine protein kinase
MESLTGKQLGPYYIIEPLGEGGMAVVFKAYQPSADRYVAVKVQPRQLASEPQVFERFRREARLLAKLQHPFILPMFDYGEEDGYPYIVMPLVPGGTLASKFSSQPMSWGEILKVVSQVGQALDYAHANGVVHRDVKPNNILLDGRGNCLLTDFGTARMVEGNVKLTISGKMIGTPAYMAPEQAMGEKVGASTDLYALGVVLYQMATGRVPFQAETPAATLFKLVNDPLLPPRQCNQAIPEAVERVILKALSKQPGQRYATAGELLYALQAALARADLAAPPVVTPAVAVTEPSSIMKTTRRPLARKLQNTWAVCAGSGSARRIGRQPAGDHCSGSHLLLAGR